MEKKVRQTRTVRSSAIPRCFYCYKDAVIKIEYDDDGCIFVCQEHDVTAFDMRRPGKRFDLEVTD